MPITPPSGPPSPDRPADSDRADPRDSSLRPCHTLQPADSPGERVILKAGAKPVPDYELLHRLGRGGFGEVWKAKGPGGFAVALKFIRLGGQADVGELRSLELIKDIRHPHVLSVFGTWERDDFLIIAMELADRALLDRWQEAQAQGLEGIPLPELLNYMREATKGIDHVNALGIQHRDIKPQNLLLMGGGVKVADFGLAKLLGHSVATASGAMTPSYAAPEMFGGHATRWSDQYSLAVTYCQLRGGRLPFEGHLGQVMTGHLMEPPDLTMLPEAERSVIARALAKKPEERWPNCREFVEALVASAGNGQPANPGQISARTATPIETLAGPPPANPAREIPSAVSVRPRLIARRWRTLVLAAAVLLLTLAVILPPGKGPQPDETKPDDKLPLKELTKNHSDGKGTAPPVHAETTDLKAKGEGPPVPPEKPPVPPKLELAVLAPLTLEAGQSTTLDIRVQRQNCTSAIKLQLEGLPNGVTLQPAVIPADADRGQLTLTASAQAGEASRTLRLVAVAPNARAETSLPLTIRRPAPAKEVANTLGMKLVLIPAGEFRMGSPDDDSEAADDEKPQHEVQITQAFYLSQHEVTRGQFRNFVDNAGYKTDAEKDGFGGWGYDAATDSFKGPKFNTEKRTLEGPASKYSWRDAGFEQTDEHPVVNVSWNDAQAFCAWLSKKEGRKYRLPTEAEWEFSCRAGTTTRYSSGDDPETLAKVGNVADGTAKKKFKDWTTITAEDGYVFTAPVGKFQPNAWGLYDMHGNVWEWCEDRYDEKYYRNSPAQDPSGPDAGWFRALRGGSFVGTPGYCRAADRAGRVPAYRFYHIGFRVVLVP
jgi:formylglycine-generating enzyme required for sulfatase activity/serine/threonine protein kinase